MGGHERQVNEGNHAVREASATEISTHPAHDARRKTSIGSRSYQDWLSEGRHFMTEEDATLVRELLRVGFKPARNIGSFGVFQFRRS